MNKRKLTPILISFLFFSFSVKAQESQPGLSKKYTLFDIVQLARNQSTAWLQAETRKENRFWQFKTYRSNFNPQLVLTGTLPDFQRRFASISQDDGSYVFQAVSNNNSNLALRLNQTIGATGGRIFINSSVDRFDDFDRDFTQYSGTPISIGLVQPILQFNPWAWDKKIEPLRYEESQKEYFEELEQISIDVTTRYFSLMLAQINLEIATKNLANNDTIYKIAQGRYELGKIGENELLQLESNLINSRLDVAQAELDLETSTLDLKSFVGFGENESIELILPEDIPTFDVNEEVALVQAKTNRVDPVSFKRRVLESERQVAQARGENGINLDLVAQYGLNNRGADFSDIYRDPNDQQLVRLDLTVPILDWGRQKSRIKTAEANRKLIEYQVAQDEINFEQEVFTKVKSFKMLREQLKVRKRSDELENRKYEISKQYFLIGKTDITTLNIALKDKDEAKRNYISSLKTFWEAYFELRKLTLYDFSNSTLLLRDIKDN
ncbi:TolC family protein [Fulvivirgaceae bacterium BMA10]|uniref:TolC family protein n=1 Tax=Splendidivirga corallicola TaxID=3051826 RepID=A0ABT8KJE4_9BACT|nr:TolC family protein [Fulvivirgaceae bacterium BMA10]